MSKIDNAIGTANGICPLNLSAQVSPSYLPPANVGVWEYCMAYLLHQEITTLV